MIDVELKNYENTDAKKLLDKIKEKEGSRESYYISGTTLLDSEVEECIGYTNTALDAMDILEDIVRNYNHCYIYCDPNNIRECGCVDTISRAASETKDMFNEASINSIQFSDLQEHIAQGHYEYAEAMINRIRRNVQLFMNQDNEDFCGFPRCIKYEVFYALFNTIYNIFDDTTVTLTTAADKVRFGINPQNAHKNKFNAKLLMDYLTYKIKNERNTEKNTIGHFVADIDELRAHRIACRRFSDLLNHIEFKDFKEQRWFPTDYVLGKANEELKTMFDLLYLAKRINYLADKLYDNAEFETEPEGEKSSLTGY